MILISIESHGSMNIVSNDTRKTLNQMTPYNIEFHDTKNID